MAAYAIQQRRRLQPPTERLKQLGAVASEVVRPLILLEQVAGEPATWPSDDGKAAGGSVEAGT